MHTIISLIPSLTDDEASVFKEYLESRSAPKGYLLIQVDDISDDLFFIVSGDFNVYKKITTHKKDIAVQMASLNAPLIFGEINFFMKNKRTAAVVAATDSKYYVLTKDGFGKLKQSNPAIALKVIEHLAIASAERSLQFEKRVHNVILKKSTSASQIIDKIDNYLGPAHICSPEVARKLFGIEYAAPVVHQGGKVEDAASDDNAGKEHIALKKHS